MTELERKMQAAKDRIECMMMEAGELRLVFDRVSHVVARAAGPTPCPFCNLPGGFHDQKIHGGVTNGDR